MSCTARLVEVAKAVERKLAGLADPAIQLTVERAYAPEWLSPDYWQDNPNLASDFTGRRVYVFPNAKVHQGPATRGEDSDHYEIAVVVLERYQDQAKTVPAAWVDERVSWVETEIFRRLGDAREADDPVLDEDSPVSAVPASVEWFQVYSADLLHQLRLFRSDVRVVYEVIEDPRA